MEETHVMVEEGLKNKANKKSTVAALSKKANKQEVEDLYRQTATELTKLKEDIALLASPSVSE